MNNNIYRSNTYPRLFFITIGYEEIGIINKFN